MTERYLGVLGVAEALGVSRHAVHKWRSRYPSGSAHPFPEPDVEVDGAPGWAAARLDEIVQWRNGLPGRGAGGGRPTAARQEYLQAALARGFTRDEALRALDTFVAEFPEMTESEVCAFLLEKWRGLDEIGTR
jgi:transposase-like protein